MMRRGFIPSKFGKDGLIFLDVALLGDRFLMLPWAIMALVMGVIAWVAGVARIRSEVEAVLAGVAIDIERLPDSLATSRVRISSRLE